MQHSWLVTGGAGFIGSNLVQRLVRNHPGARIVTFDALTYAGNLENLKPVEDAANHVFVRGDIADPDDVRAVFAEYAITGVYHLAAESHVDRSIHDSAAFIRTNVNGTHTLLEGARDAWLGEGKTPGRFLHVSTDEVFGSLGPDDPPFNPATPYAPNSPYSASKAGSDHLVRAYHHTYGLDVVTTNCSNNYGPYQFPEKLIPLMICNAVEGKPLPVYGDGMNVRDWLYVDDHAAAIETAFLRGRPGAVYTIGGNAETANIDVVHAICDLVDELHGADGPAPRRRLITYVKDRPGHDRRYAIDASLVESELGWKPSRTFEEGLRETVRWYLDNAEWTERCRSGAYRDYYDRNYAGR